MLLSLLGIAGCRATIDGYLPVAAIARNGFASHPEAPVEARGRDIKLWGYVDHGNLYGDKIAREILEEWWGGEGPAPDTWRFNLKAAAEDAVGDSFAVFVANDPGRRHLLERFVVDARGAKPTRVFVSGKLLQFEAPAQFTTLTGFYLEVASSDGIKLDEEGGSRRARFQHNLE